MKTHHGAFKVGGAFQAAARPLCAGAVFRQPRQSAAAAVVADSGDGRPTLAELAEGPYFVLALLLDGSTLCCADATCRLLRQLNRARIGPWRALGARAFHGLELEREGTFEQPAAAFPELERGGDGSCASGRKLARIDWKGRYHHFRVDVPTFCAPFAGPEITTVAHPDEVAYFRCRLCTDVLGEASDRGVYLEVEVLSNPDNLSMAVVDFEAGGCSSVTFSPDTGAVIRERKVREAPRKVEGAYIQPLPTVPPGRRFRGLMGLYLWRGRLAFFRRCEAAAADGAPGGGSPVPPAAVGVPNQVAAAGSASAPSASGGLGSPSELLLGAISADIGGSPARAAPGVVAAEAAGGRSLELGPWESTGFVSDLGWAEGRRLTPCLAFRDEGAYRVRVVCVGTHPPIPPEGGGGSESEEAEGENEAGWSGFDWEVGAPTVPDAVDA